jgi:dihydrofolate reductase
MRKLIVFNLITLDGFFAGPNGEIDWHDVDEEFNAFAVEQLEAVGTLLFGRVTYEGMLSYWPTADPNDPIADKMNNLPKVVCSKSLDRVEWGTWDNATLVKDNLPEAISTLKQQPGGDLMIFGSGTIVSLLAGLGLIDEYRIMVSPIILGSGKPLFSGLDHSVRLRLLKTRAFRLGNVLHYYEPDRA